MPTKRQIKKYPNRRLYDTQTSSYISLKELSEIVKSGEQVEVADVKTNEDVTAFVLTQILMNKAKEDNTLLPVSLLHIVIQFGENDLHDFFENYLEKSIDNYLTFRKKMDDQLRAYMEMGTEFSSFTEKVYKDFNFFDPSSTFFGHKDRNK